MNALAVWRSWRRILTDDALVAHLADPAAPLPLGHRASAPADHAILADYARTPVATATNIGMYRRGLTRNALGTLSLVPLTRHLLFMSDLDIDDVAERFCTASGYRDFGPNFWTSAAAFVDFIGTLPEFAAPAHQDLIALDRATVALALRLGAHPPGEWPAAHDAPATITPATRLVASPAAIVVGSRHDLGEWIAHPQEFDPAEPPPADPGHWLVYFPAAEAAPAYVQLSERAARLMTLLAAPAHLDDTAAAVGMPAAQAVDIARALAGLNVLVTPA